MQDNVLVSVYFITYNHKDFIQKSLDGVVNQKTDFKYEIVLYDDGSTDGTREIVKEYTEKYPDLFNPILPEENRAKKEGFYKINTEIYSKCRGKYIAYCEGDDCWTDENKLQTQVDFMESHPDFAGCFHKSERKDETGKSICFMPTEKQLKGKTAFDIYDTYKGYFIETVSVMYRFDRYKEEFLKTYPDGMINNDSYYIYFYSIKGKIGYIDKLMSVKTISTQGVWNSTNQTLDEKYIRFANEIVKFPLEVNKLLEKNRLKLIYETPENAMKRVLLSALKLKRTDLFETLAKNFPDVFENLLNGKDLKKELKKKINKYKVLTFFFLAVSAVYTLIFVYFLLKNNF